MDYKNRGHFCNYWRKVITNKLREAGISTPISVNQVIWYAWDHPEQRDEIIKEIIALDAMAGYKAFSAAQKALLDKYGFENSSSDFWRKKNYIAVTGIQI